MTKPFDCSACGACCRRVSVVPGWPLREDGACYFLQADNKCGIYETRPAICRVDESRPEGMDVATWHRLNADACKRLQDEETPLAAPPAPRLPPGMNWTPKPGMKVRRVRNADDELKLKVGDVYTLDGPCRDRCGNWTLEHYTGICGAQRPLFHPDNFEPAEPSDTKDETGP